MNRSLPHSIGWLLTPLLIILLLSGCWFSSDSPNDIEPAAAEPAVTVPKAADTTIVFEEPDSQPDEAAPVEDKVVPVDADQRGNKPRVAILIDDMGYHRKIGNALLNMDLQLSFAFLPHSPFARELAESAHQKGRDIMVHLPMEAGDRKWAPGPGALYLATPADERAAILKKDLAAIPHAIGANNHMGSKFTKDRQAMHEVLAELQQQGLFFIDSFTTAQSTGMDEAQKMGVKTNRRHVFLDNVQNPEKICLQLDKLAALAVRRQQAIAIGHPYQATLDALRSCGDKLLTTVQIVPVHTLVK